MAYKKNVHNVAQLETAVQDDAAAALDDPQKTEADRSTTEGFTFSRQVSLCIRFS